MVDLYDAIAEERGIRMRTRVQGPLVIPGDRQLMATAIASLLDNALKYSAAPSTVEITLLKSAGEVRLTVLDEGPGIPEQDLPRVTERFFRVDTSRHLPGNGLGLAIVDGIARLHGGRLELRNSVPGLAASLVFPLAG
jgi:signal transduction histidine kinase